MSAANLKTYVGVLSAFAATLVASWVYWYGVTLELNFALGAVFFAGLLLLADRLPIHVTEHAEISAVEVCLMGSVVVLGPFWAAVAALPYAAAGGRKDWLRTAYETSCVTVEVYLAGIVFSFASGPLLTASPQFTVPMIVYAALASGATMLSVNAIFNMILLKVKFRQDFKEIWASVIEPYLLACLLSILTIGFGVLALLSYGPVAALVVLAGSIASQVLVYRSRERVQKLQELQNRVRSLEESLTTSNVSFGTMIIREMGRADGYTDRHAAATAVFAADLADEMKLGEMRVRRVRLAGLVHNVGMFGLPQDILTSTGKLNSVGQSRLAEHPARGEEVLAAVPEFKEMAGWVRWHHERPDGRGYPDRLRGPWIPPEARILAVAQAYAALVLDQPRRPGLGFKEARGKLIAGAGTEFDELVVRAFLRILDTESDGYRMADDDRFIFPDPAKAIRTGNPDEPESGVSF